MDKCIIVYIQLNVYNTKCPFFCGLRVAPIKEKTFNFKDDNSPDNQRFVGDNFITFNTLSQKQCTSVMLKPRLFLIIQ